MDYIVMKTNAGLALDLKMPNSGSFFTFVRAESGGGSVPQAQLPTLLAVTNPMQELELKDLIYPQSSEGPLTIPVTLSNSGLETGYALYQVGVYAEDPDLGEILYLVAQTTRAEGEPIPSEASSPGFAIDWNLATHVANTEIVQVVVNEAGRLTVDQGDARYLKKEDTADTLQSVQEHMEDTENPHGVTAQQTGAISAEAKGTAGGVAELDAAGKVPAAQLPTLGLSEEDVEALVNAGQDLIFTNVSVPASTWTATSNYTYAKYQAIVNLAGVTSAMDAEVFFAPNDADSGIFSGAGIVNDGSITLLAIKQPTSNLTIPKIRFMKGANT